MILITGAAGFVGSYLCQELEKQKIDYLGIDSFNNYYDPKIKVRRAKGLNIIKLDILDFDKLEKLFKKYKFNDVVHLAAYAGVKYSLRNPKVYIENNILGTSNLLTLCIRYNIRDFIYASSSSVYGDTNIPFKEEQELNPISPYGFTKKAIEEMAMLYSKLYGIKTIGLRFFTVYGEDGRPDMAYYKFTKAIIENKPINLYEGGIMRDFTYISDVIGGIMDILIRGGEYPVYNLGNNKPVKLDDFIGILEKCIGKKAIKIYKQLPIGEVKKTFASIDRMKNEFGWQPKVNIEEGLERFVKWYKESVNKFS